MSAYYGKWMNLAGYAIAVTPVGEAISVTLVASSGADFGDYLWFPKDRERLELANLGDIITARGKIRGLSARGLVFEDCELSEITTPEVPIALFAAPAEVRETTPSAPAEQKPPTEQKSMLAVAEMDRFAQVYLEIFGAAAVEGKALSAVRACYPDHQIGRDAFFKIFRELRGPGKRGNPAFRGN